LNFILDHIFVVLQATLLSPANVPLGNQIQVINNYVVMNSMSRGSFAGAVITYNLNQPTYGTTYAAQSVLNGTNSQDPPLTGPWVFAYWDNTTNSVAVLYTTLLFNLQLVNIRPNLTVNVLADPTNPVTSSYFNLTASNNFSSQTVTFSLTGLPPYVPPKSGGLSGVAIFFIIFGILVFLAGAFFAFRWWKARQSNFKHTPQINESSMNISNVDDAIN